MRFLLATLLLVSCSRRIKDNNLIIGTGVASNVTVEAAVGNPNNPKIRFNTTTSKWEFSNDGTTFTELQ